MDLYVTFLKETNYVLDRKKLRLLPQTYVGWCKSGVGNLFITDANVYI